MTWFGVKNPTGPHPGTRWLSLLAGLVVVAGFAGVLQWSWSTSLAKDREQAAMTASAFARMLADRTVRVFTRADQLTRLAARGLGSTPPANMPNLEDLLIDGPATSALLLVDAEGHVVRSSLPSAPSNVAQTAYFEMARRSPDGLHVGEPIYLADWSPSVQAVPFVRAVLDAQGRFSGAAILLLKTTRLTAFEELPGQPRAVFAVVNEGGRVLSRTEGHETAAGGSISFGDWRRLLATPADSRLLPVLTGPADDVPRFTALESVEHDGLVALVGLPVGSALEPTHALFRRIAPVVLLLMGGVLCAGLFIHRQGRLVVRALRRREQAEAALNYEKNFFALTLGTIHDAVITADEHEHVTYMNPRAEVLLSCAVEDALGRPLRDVMSVRAGDDAWSPAVSGSLQKAVLLALDGQERPVEFVVSPMPTPSGRDGQVVVMHDVSKATQLAERLSHQATHDALTSLPNRAAFNDRLDEAVQEAQGARGEHVLLFLDLDQFKVVNDSCGHVAGDELLKQVAFLLQQVVRRNDTVARMGGDEFAVLLQHCPVDVGLGVANKLRAQIADFRFSWQGRIFNLGVSIGAVAVTAISRSREELMRMADTACYIAKDAGRNRVHVYSESDCAVVERQGELHWTGTLQRAMEQDRIELVGQRILGLHEPRHIERYEVLMRLRTDDGQLIAPMAFLPAAERYGLMPTLDRLVIDKALALHRTIQQRTEGTLKFSINLSGASLSDASLLPYIRDALARHGVPPEHICFEVTETVAIANLQVAVNLMRQLKGLGCTMALDDFGSGMASFGYLKQLPVDVVKIDGSFVRDMLVDPVDFAMVEAVRNIAHRMGILTQAEYVESPELIEALERMGVDMVQGYGVARPEDLLLRFPAARQARLDDAIELA